MPVSGKLFYFRTSLDLENVKTELEHIHTVSVVEGIQLEHTVELYPVEGTELLGLYVFDELVVLAQRGDPHVTYKTTSSQFLFFDKDGTQYLLIMAPKATANKIAVWMNDSLGQDIREARISDKSLREYAEAFEKTSLAFFKDLEFVNTDKAALYGGEGGNIAQTDLWGELLAAGSPQYVLGRDTMNGYTVGVVSDGAVTIFNNVGADDYQAFIKDEITKLVLRRTQE